MAEPWEAWAPPLNPDSNGQPHPGGMPYDVAAGIADLYWEDNPHLCAALQWEWYAATLPMGPAVQSVSTGAQSITYNPSAMVGTAGEALAKANWHRSLISGRGMGSIALNYGGGSATEPEDEEDIEARTEADRRDTYAARWVTRHGGAVRAR